MTPVASSSGHQPDSQHVAAGFVAPSDDEALIHEIDAMLPQTQCQRCGYPACRPYAAAIVQEGVAVNRCPPGGQAGLERIAKRLGRPVITLDPSCGIEQAYAVAVIDETQCIGCTKCIQVCPTDAIVGAIKRMHTVLPDWCTSCELCIPPCPVDCITMSETLADGSPKSWSDRDAELSRERYQARQARLAREAERIQRRNIGRAEVKLQQLEREPLDPTTARKKALVAAALAKAQARSKLG